MMPCGREYCCCATPEICRNKYGAFSFAPNQTEFMRNIFPPSIRTDEDYAEAELLDMKNRIERLEETVKRLSKKSWGQDE